MLAKGAEKFTQKCFEWKWVKKRSSNPAGGRMLLKQIVLRVIRILYTLTGGDKTV
jgi:hypothetical protein